MRTSETGKGFDSIGVLNYNSGMKNYSYIKHFSVILNLFQDLIIKRFRNKFVMTKNCVCSENSHVMLNLFQHLRNKRFRNEFGMTNLLYSTDEPCHPELVSGSKLESFKKSPKLAAFTLAEVLITLGIIGIVVVLTIPTLVKKYQRYVLHNQFQVAYSIVSEAVKKMSIDNPKIMDTYCASHASDNSIEARTKFAKDFSKYFVVISDKTSDTTFSVYGGKALKQPNYKKFSNQTDVNGYNDGQFVISNGMIISNGHCWIGASPKGQHVEFLVDTNGLKEPNAMGYDLFYFWIDPANNVVTCPQIPKNTNYCNFLTADTTGAHNGVNCSYFALRNEFPNDLNKKYWDSLP